MYEPKARNSITERVTFTGIVVPDSRRHPSTHGEEMPREQTTGPKERPNDELPPHGNHIHT